MQNSPQSSAPHNHQEQSQGSSFAEISPASDSFFELMRWEGDQDIQSWAEPILEQLAKQAGALQATLYYLSEDGQSLELMAWYAPAFLDRVLEEIPLGEGTIGICAKRHTIQKVMLSPGQYRAYSATNIMAPEQIRAVPLLSNHKLIGVAEFQFLQQPGDQAWQEMQGNLPFVAAAISSILNDLRLRETLETVRESQERLQTIDELSTQGIAFIDNQIILEHNSAFSKIFEREGQDLTQMHLAQLLGCEEALQTIDKASQNTLFELECPISQGKTLFAEVERRAATFRKRQVEVLTMLDITDRKEAEAQLEEANKVIELTREIEEKNKKITSSINYAQRIQQSLLPCQSDMTTALSDYFLLYLTKDVVSGDFYWYHRIDQYRHLVAAVDCTGHGIPGAFLSFIGFTALNAIVKHVGIHQPDRILGRLHEEITTTFQQQNQVGSADGMDIALLYLDYESRKWAYSGAHRPLVQVRDGDMFKYKGTKAPIGGKHHQNINYELHEGQWKRNDMFYLFTDGYADQFNDAGKKFMTKKLHRYLANIADQPVDVQRENLLQTFENWKGNHAQMDDVLVIGIRLT